LDVEGSILLHDDATMRIPRLRFSMRAMIVAMTATSLAVCFVVSPVYRVLEERRGSQQLLAAGATLEHSIYLKRDYKSPALEQPSTPATSQEELPTWIAALAGDAATLRPDVEVLEVYAHDDAQVQALCEHGERFRQLQVIDLWGNNISSNQVSRFQASLSKFPQAVDFHFLCPIPPNFLSSLGQARSIFLWGPGTYPPRFDGSRAKELATIANLELLWIKRYPLKIDDAIHLAQSKSLRRMYLEDTGMSAADFSRLKAAMPNCEVSEECRVETNRQHLPPGSWGTFSATR
jgi:hypothetical protein